MLKQTQRLFLFFFSFIGAPVIHSQDLILPKEATPYVDENDFQTEDPMKVKDLFSVNNILKLFIKLVINNAFGNASVLGYSLCCVHL